MSKNKIAHNKTLEIRIIARQMVSEGKAPRPIEIMERLKVRGIKVYSSQVSTALRGTEFALRQSRVNWESLRPCPLLTPDPAEAISQITQEIFSKAQDFVREVGSMENALAALVVIGQFKKSEPEKEEYYGGA